MYNTDRNHLEIKRALQDAGCTVYDGAHIGRGFPDLIAARQGGPVTFLEVKDGELPPSRRKLTGYELEFQATWGSHYHVVLTTEDALRAVGVLA